MTWGFFSIAHIASLVLAVALIVALYFILRKVNDTIKTIVLGILSFSGIAAIIFNLVVWDSPLEYLPFHLCSIQILFILVVN
jgi:hypothetical protein